MEDELYHHGIKGMKWGIRRKRPEISKKSSKSTSPKKSDSNDIRKKIAKGKESVDRFMNSNAGTLVKSAAIIGLASVGAPAALVTVGNMVLFGQSPLRTWGLDGMDAQYESMRGVHLDPIEH